MNITRNQPRFLGFLIAGAIAGMIGGAMMAMFTMIATATYLGMGFFTPMYVIASPLSGPQAMMAAMHGGAFYFTLGPAILGLVVHMMWSALWGIIFGLIASGLHLRGGVAVIGGMVYGVLVMLLMNFVLLPIVGAPNLLNLLGGTTFIIGHLLFGMVVGLWPVLRPQDFSGLLGRRARQSA
jgi:uncharacterized membrane protein YagU involved in acid resistance